MGAHKSELRRVAKYSEADVIVRSPFGNKSWYRLSDLRSGVRDTDNDLTMREGDIAMVKRMMREAGVRTYAMEAKHKCEAPGCRTDTPYAKCAFHSDPAEDVVFCMMTGTPHKTLGKIEGEVVYTAGGAPESEE